MEALTQVIAAIPASALPLVVVIVAVTYLFFKFKGTEKDREQTKAIRDKDSQDVHDSILKLQFEMANLKGITDLHRETLEDLRKQMTIVVKELAELNCSIKMILEEKRK
jgi:hypothetical protein